MKQIFKKAIIVKSPFKIGQLVTYDDLNEALEKNPDLVKFPVEEPTVKKTKKESVKVIHSVGNIKYVGSQIINEALKTISIFYFDTSKIRRFCPHLAEHGKKYQNKNVWYKKRKT